MEVKTTGIAGTLESSDIMITIEKNEGSKEITVNLKSSVMNQFGNQIRKVISETLQELEISGVTVNANDKGALDCTIKARVMAAAYRACKNENYVF